MQANVLTYTDPLITYLVCNLRPVILQGCDFYLQYFYVQIQLINLFDFLRNRTFTYINRKMLAVPNRNVFKVEASVGMLCSH